MNAHETRKVVKKTQLIAVAGATMLAVVAFEAQARDPSYPTLEQPGFTAPTLDTSRLTRPDFYMLTVMNPETTGPGAFLKAGACSNKMRAVTKNLGASYKYGATYGGVTGGQILVVMTVQNAYVGSTGSSGTKYYYKMDNGEVVNADFDVKFPKIGNYTVRAEVFACKRGSSTTSCARVPESKTDNNWSAVDVYVNRTC